MTASNGAQRMGSMTASIVPAKERRLDGIHASDGASERFHQIRSFSGSVAPDCACSSSAMQALICR